MEPRGCNQWQSAANRTAAKGAKTSQTVAMGCDQLPRAAHGKGALPKKGRGSPLWLRKKRQVLRTQRPTGLDDADPDTQRFRRQAGLAGSIAAGL
jgi:hypothetical protein